MVMVTMVMVGVSHALKCYKCEGSTKGADTSGKHCLDTTVKMATCKAKEFCATIEDRSPKGMIHSFILSDTSNSSSNSTGSSNSYLGDL